MTAKTPQLSVSIEKLILQMQAAGKIRTAQIYRTALNNFLRFRAGVDLPLTALSPEIILAYETWMRGRGLMRNSSSFYLRSLRSAWRKAMGARTVREDPFSQVYTGVDKTVKRAVSLSEIRRLKALDLEGDEAWARDLFLFSFFTRGMAFVDMAYLRKADLCGGLLTYCRRKTGQPMAIRWEPCMQEIVDRLGPTPTEYLLPILTRTGAKTYNE